MRSIKRIPAFLFTLFLPALLGILAVPSATAAFRYLHEGMKMPQVIGADLTNGQEVSSDMFIRDSNILVICFWATWSQRSIEELKALKKIALEYSDKPVQIIAVNVDDAVLSKNKIDEIKQYISDLDLPFPSIIDKNLSIFNSFGVIAVPSTAITDSTGIIKYGPAGYSLTTRELIVDSLLVLLGLKERSESIAIRDGYIPKDKSLRYYYLALNLRLQGLYERALSNLALAQEADPNFPAPYNLRGEIDILLDEPEKAIEEFTTALSLDSEFVAAKAGLGKALYLNNKTEEAISHLNALISKDDTYTPAIISLSQCYKRQNKNMEALNLLQKALDLNPRDLSLLYNLGGLHRLNNDNAQATTAYKTALEIIFPEK